MNCLKTGHRCRILFTGFWMMGLILMFSSCASQSANQHRIYNSNQKTSSHKKVALHEFYGKASYYGPQFHGKKTASGEIFDQHALTAAHPSLAFGTRCRVTNLKNGKQVVVRINDRGPFVKGRILDLSYQAANAIGAVADGVVEVKVEVLKK